MRRPFATILIGLLIKIFNPMSASGEGDDVSDEDEYFSAEEGWEELDDKNYPESTNEVDEIWKTNFTELIQQQYQLQPEEDMKTDLDDENNPESSDVVDEIWKTYFTEYIQQQHQLQLEEVMKTDLDDKNYPESTNEEDDAGSSKISSGGGVEMGGFATPDGAGIAGGGGFSFEEAGGGDEGFGGGGGGLGDGDGHFLHCMKESKQAEADRVTEDAYVRVLVKK
jgi:hypothetical protein